MDGEGFDAWTRTLGRARSRRLLAGTGGALAGALGLRGMAVPARAQGEVTVCEDGQTLVLPEPAAQTLLARGATPGRCTTLGAIGCEAGRELCAGGTVCCGLGDFCTRGDFCCPGAQYCPTNGRCCPARYVCEDGACVGPLR